MTTRTKKTPELGSTVGTRLLRDLMAQDRYPMLSTARGATAAAGLAAGPRLSRPAASDTADPAGRQCDACGRQPLPPAASFNARRLATPCLRS
ncbi:conserved hypothetical protein [Xanthomonas citri pv. bilvae]|nr:conserved hypothetical protein [Xanthomonas citri pv. bilvae]